MKLQNKQKRVSRKTSSIFAAVIIFITVSGITGEYNRAWSKPKWRYIVVHHSGTKIGNAKRFDIYHRKVRHMKNGIGYHFVIDDGSCGTEDGQIEITRRWEKQLPGGHCRQQVNNNQGIGICLVGNFQKTRPTKQQFWALVWLVRKLMRENNIPLKNVKGHGEMHGENTVCPGRYFSMKRLKAEIPKKK